MMKATHNKDSLKNIHPAIILELIADQFSHCFNGYVQAYNKQYNRMGALMVQSFKRKKVSGNDSLKRVICYIHKNPVSARMVKRPEDWKFSTSHILLSEDPGFLMRSQVFDLFGGRESFMREHETPEGV